MKLIRGSDRHQIGLFPVSLDDSIDADNEVRFIDLFVDALDMGSYGCKMEYIDNGRPAYHPADLLKLFLFNCLKQD